MRLEMSSRITASGTRATRGSQQTHRPAEATTPSDDIEYQDLLAVVAVLPIARAISPSGSSIQFVT